MLLKALLYAMAMMVGGVGTLRASVMLENYVLLVGGVLLSLAAVILVGHAAQRRGEPVRG